MNKACRRLGSAELEIMLAVWAAEEPVQSGYIHEKLRDSRNWSLPAVITSLNRLVEKGFLSCDRRGRGNLYSPLVSEDAYKATEGRSLLDRLYGSSCKSLVASLVDGRAIGREELAELRAYLDELEGE